MKIALLSPCGYGNLGDAAIQDAVIQNIRCRFSPVAIYGVTLNPPDTERRHRIPTFPLRRRSSHKVGTCLEASAPEVPRTGGPSGLSSVPPRWRGAVRRVWDFWGPLREVLAEASHWFRSYRFLNGFDFLIVSGGGQIDEFWGGPWGHPYALLKWAILARLAGARLIFLNVGVGGITTALSRVFVRRSLVLASYASYRDQGSAALMRSLGALGGNVVLPDLAFSLDTKETVAPANSMGLLVGIGPMPYGDPRIWPDKDEGLYRSYITKLALFAVWLLNEGHSVFLYAGQVNHDCYAIADICEILDKTAPLHWRERVLTPPSTTVQDLLRLLSTASMLVGSRLHGVLLPLLLGRPVLAISHERKVAALMEEMGLQQYCLHIREFKNTELIERFRSLEDNRLKVEAAIRGKVATFRDLLNQQYDFIINRFFCQQGIKP
jgi:polysaccharide pyruvyl transferase WcaK-like protein